jgi:hypothetical protein
MGLHRIALFVFEFNERAVRAYKRCGFVIEGRARESIWRDGRWWDELAMSVLESDWRKRRAAAEAASAAADGPSGLDGPTGPTAPAGDAAEVTAPPTVAAASGTSGASDRLRRAFGRLR